MIDTEIRSIQGAMQQVNRVQGRGIVLRGNDIDTDRIIPARFLRCVTFDGLGAQVFADDRLQAQGQHPFDQPQFQGANILVTNANFGCGSSREHAPQALLKWGIQAVVGESFAEIFLGNCVSLGVPCVTATAGAISQLQTAIETDPNLALALDLEAMLVTFGQSQISVVMGEGIRQMFRSGQWDACGQLVAQGEQIKAVAAKLPYLAWAEAL
ncbi:3-isopropylmalate dehydratase small subunit [Thermosynechococcaceae cyanobacterium BACA0444]|uniref:3-isopropylmalate dehydratase n=1 Tax=Pseudocalidococcus azoricus BACA0444 TaxID=2918990 RepID=A0AAE4FWM1_9CYAN|nr:3-isopropylmalate dehydratase small subunit [Pseudocalidococcus azoricus]MDS3862326.1 3-isopropylmalate dehydratase small subunit [Pseudocalidococcus azoricus BACA0444]